MTKIMLQFRSTDKKPTLQDVREKFHLSAGELDSEYGVVLTDTQEGLYTVLVEEAARAKVDEALKQMGADQDPAVGLFSNPSIAPFDLPKGGFDPGI